MFADGLGQTSEYPGSYGSNAVIPLRTIITAIAARKRAMTFDKALDPA